MKRVYVPAHKSSRGYLEMTAMLVEAGHTVIIRWMDACATEGRWGDTDKMATADVVVIACEPEDALPGHAWRAQFRSAARAAVEMGKPLILVGYGQRMPGAVSVGTRAECVEALRSIVAAAPDGDLSELTPALAEKINAGLVASRAKFPVREKPRGNFTALIEEVGELANAMLEHGAGSPQFEKECIHVAVMAVRVLQEGPGGNERMEAHLRGKGERDTTGQKVYFAAHHGRREDLRGYAEEMSSIGYSVDARWLRCNHELDEEGLSTRATLEERVRYAAEDMEDLRAADIVVVFTDLWGTGPKGACDAEFGAAVALGKRVIIVGEDVNILHRLPGIEGFASWRECALSLMADACGAAMVEGWKAGCDLAAQS